MQIDHQLDLDGLLDRQVAGLLSLEDAPRVHASLAVGIVDTRAVAHQPASFREIARCVDRSDTMPCDPGDDAVAAAKEEYIRDGDEAGDPLFCQGRESGVQLPVGRGVHDDQLAGERIAAACTFLT